MSRRGREGARRAPARRAPPRTPGRRGAATAIAARPPPDGGGENRVARGKSGTRVEHGQGKFIASSVSAARRRYIMQAAACVAANCDPCAGRRRSHQCLDRGAAPCWSMDNGVRIGIRCRRATPRAGSSGSLELPQLGDAGRPRRADRGGRLRRRGGPLPSLCRAVCPWASRTLIARKLKRLDDVDFGHGRRADMTAQGWRFGDYPAPAPTRSTARLHARDLHPRRPAFHRPGDRAGAVGQEATDDRQQRIRRHRADAEFRLRRAGGRRDRSLSRRSSPRRSTR